MRVRLLFFAALRDVVGAAEQELVLPDDVNNVARLLECLPSEIPTLRARLASVRVAINETFVDGDASLQEGDTVALLPPVTGG